MGKAFNIEERTKLANAAFINATRRAIAVSRQTNTPFITWRSGQIVELTPDEAEAELNANLAKQNAEKEQA
ncbi:hypothetical protein [Rubinisphaera margarita]|uniref:hypothetical protein n=1 Tax=Rubinisphaera margarita TaxID=2909586 RepID=UPI001EE90C08|nr:hypothetical protein [Rubinisphaera margarita]MCG6155359.1 hypothetical protein [Rubinisphaera margarita]